MILATESAYTIENGLVINWNEPETTGYITSPPGQHKQEELLLKKLGINGWGRLHYFRQEFSGSWGEGTEKPFSPKAQAVFLRFLKDVTFPEGIRPSIFLTKNGHIELCWEDSEGDAIQFEFGPKESEVYIESKDIEETIDNTKLADYIPLVSA